MKTCLKLAYCAFSSSPSRDATVSTFWDLSSLFLLNFKLFQVFFPFQNVIANLCVRVASVCVCVCVHPLNKDVSQAIIGTFFQCLLQKMVGWIAFEVSLRFMLKIKLF